eukprot:gene1338-3227_t
MHESVTQWHDMPNGKLMHESCIHQHDQPFQVLADDSVKLANGTVIVYGPCPHAARNRRGGLGRSEAAAPPSAPLAYYSDWVAYAKNPHASGVGGMSSDWTMPDAPTSRGPAPPLIASSIYLFNDLEDGMGTRDNASVILQPVLQYGKSGCLLNPAKQHDWYFTSYLVTGAGRAHCGANLGPLSPGEKVRGTMTLLDAGGADGDGTASGNNTWRVDSTRLSTGDVSSTTADMGDIFLDTAYVTLEAMVIYSCAAYPKSNSVLFDNNTVVDRAGSALTS